MYRIWRFFLDFGGILAIENLKKYMILALVISNTAFWLNTASKKKATCCWCWPAFFFGAARYA
jgi:hypothetical protein